MFRYSGEFGGAVWALLFGAVLACVGAPEAQAAVMKVDFSFSADALAGDPYSVNGSFTYDDSLTGIINGSQFLSESLSIRQGVTDLPTIEDYLSRFHWDIDNQAIRMPDDSINTALTAVGTNQYFLNYYDVVGLTVFSYFGAAFPQTVGITIPRNGLATGAPFSYTVTAVPEPNTVSEPSTAPVMMFGIVVLGFMAGRRPSTA